MRRYCKLALCATTAGLTGASIHVASADQWLLSGSLNQRLLLDSNIRLSSTDPRSVFGSTTSVNGDLSWSTPRASVSASAFASVARYIGDSALNNESYGMTVQSLYRLPRGSLGLGASIARASTINTERLDAGNFSEVANQLSYSIFPSWQYELSPTETLGVNGGYTRTTFDRGSFSDSSNYSLSSTWSKQLSPIERVSVGARIGFIETTGGTVGNVAVSGGKGDARSQSYGIFAGWTKSITQNLTFSLTAGPRLSIVNNQENVSDGSNVSIGADFDLSLSYAISDRTRLIAAAGQSLEPSSTGQIEERQRVSVGLQHQFSPRISSSLIAVLQHNGRTFTGGADTADNGRIFISTSANLSYRLSPTLAASFQYDFRAQDRSATQRNESSSGFAHSHAALITLTYSPRAWILGH